MNDDEVALALTRAGLPPDDMLHGPRYFNDYGFVALRIAYLAGLADGRKEHHDG